MKLRSAPLDDVYQEFDYVFSHRGDLLGRCSLWLGRTAYRWLRLAFLAALRRLGQPRG
jgi:hypothetical protein